MASESRAHRPSLRLDEPEARRWNLIAVVIALVTGLGAALLPLGMSSSIDGTGLETTRRVSLLSNEGASVLIVVAIPVLLVALPLLFRGRRAVHRSRVAIVVLLGILVVLGLASIGFFFVPTLIAMGMALASEPQRSALPPVV